ncbi:MAG TPA: DUF1232 domain-containing protein [Alphaproteobacteria bacterium]|nr:DUF1232 domain-containing protein [Alphaproteobacteria bacterium]
MLTKLAQWAANTKRDVLALYLAARDPRVPWYAKALAAFVAAYALSPIDLIPDVIPVLGLLDDILLVPLGLYLAVRLIPVEVMADLRRQAERRIREKPRSWLAAALIVALWLGAAAAMGFALSPLFD